MEYEPTSEAATARGERRRDGLVYHVGAAYLLSAPQSPWPLRFDCCRGSVVIRAAVVDYRVAFRLFTEMTPFPEKIPEPFLIVAAGTVEVLLEGTVG
jgi:hypothetical protein